MSANPRTLLLTVAPPDARNTILRRNAESLPADRFRWASLQARFGADPLPFVHRAFEPVPIHWRLHGGTLGHYWRHEWQSRALARRIGAWARDFAPEVLWVLPELGAASVGRHLGRLLGIPVHATAHDAHETARFIVPRGYYPAYARSVNAFFRQAHSADAVSAGLREHLMALYPNMGAERSIVIHPSIASRLMMPPPEAASAPAAGVRRIGLCGSLRVTTGQWREFLDLLGSLPFAVEVLSFTYNEPLPDLPLPARVAVRELPFAATEQDVIASFRAAGVHACYLGLYREPERQLFGRTSLSSKLTTYLAASLPVLTDSCSDSAAARLVSGSDAGVVLRDARGDQVPDARERLTGLLSDRGRWLQAATGAGRLCREQFDLDANMARFHALLATLAPGPQRRTK